MPPAIDNDTMNEDWLRTMSWDIWTPGFKKHVTTVDELKVALSDNMDIEHFLALPAALAMPEALRTDLIKAGYTVPDRPPPHPPLDPNEDDTGEG